MIRIGILGDIGSGKSYISKSFGYPVFNADEEVSKLYKCDQKTLKDLKKVLPKYFHSLPIDKKKVLEAIFANKNNLKKIIKVVHKQIKGKLKLFLIKNKKQKMLSQLRSGPRSKTRSHPFLRPRNPEHIFERQ